MDQLDWMAQAARLRAQHRPFALVTVLRALAPTSSKPGDKALVEADGTIHGWIGGGCAQPVVQRTVRLCLADGNSRTIRLAPAASAQERDLGDILEFGMACHSGGTLELFIDPVLAPPLLAVIGNTPMARTLAVLAPHLGFRVARIAHGLADDGSGAMVIADDDAQHVCARLPACDFVVVATQGQRDMQGLRAALALPSKQVWFVASARKAGVLFANLIASGLDASRVGSIIAPAGVPIGAQTPEEIALSVLGAVVAARRHSPHAMASEAISVLQDDSAHPLVSDTQRAQAPADEVAVVDPEPNAEPAPAAASCCCSR